MLKSSLVIVLFRCTEGLDSYYFQVITTNFTFGESKLLFILGDLLIPVDGVDAPFNFAFGDRLKRAILLLKEFCSSSFLED